MRGRAVRNPRISIGYYRLALRMKRHDSIGFLGNASNDDALIERDNGEGCLPSRPDGGLFRGRRNVFRSATRTQNFFKGQERVTPGIVLDPLNKVSVRVGRRWPGCLLRRFGLRKGTGPCSRIATPLLPSPCRQAGLGNNLIERSGIVEKFPDARRGEHQGIVSRRQVSLLQ